jgi:glycosyltransferase involved in cell wall biosynthesis
MSFANRYIERNISYPDFIKEKPSFKLGMVVVIPVINEPEVLKTIDSLAHCTPPEQEVEVLLVINQSEISTPEVSAQNLRTIQELETWKKENKALFFHLHVLVPPPFRKKHAGAGLARKTGMDEAVRRFAAIDKADGLIVSLDADTLVDEDYLIEIEKHFQKEKRQVGACVQFNHRFDEITDERQREGMVLYETYLHYYKNALAFTGFPNAIYTIGSAFVVRVSAYVKQGGMNRRQAGEDFYFLHKLAQLGTIGEINSTCIYPSARSSNRVPFGTGAAMQKWMQGDESLRLTYHFQSFVDLRHLFELLPTIYERPFSEIGHILQSLPVPVTAFLDEDGFEKSLLEIRSNASRFESFKKRFFLYFNAFKILKFQNFVHPRFYAFQDLVVAFQELKLLK